MKVSILGAAIKAQQGRLSTSELHLAIDEALRQRSHFLHRATSDCSDNGTKKNAHIFAAEIDKCLLVLLEHLPTYAPGYPQYLYSGLPDAWGKFPPEQVKRLQWVHGDNAKYVPLNDWKKDEFAYEPTSPRARVQGELSKSAEILAEIKAIEGIVSPEPLAAL